MPKARTSVRSLLSWEMSGLEGMPALIEQMQTTDKVVASAYRWSIQQEEEELSGANGQ